MNVNEADIPSGDHEDIVANFFETLDEPAETPSEDPKPEEDETPTEPVAGAPEAAEGDEDEDSEEQLDDEPSADDDPAVEETEVDWAKRYKDQQSFHTKQMSELQAQVQAMNQWAQQVHAQQMAAHQAQLQEQQRAASTPQANPYSNLSDVQIEEGVKGDLVTTFRTIVQHRPDKVAKTIALARDAYGNEVGDEMQVEYNQYITEQRAAAIEARMEAAAASQAEAEAPEQIRETMNAIIGNVASQYGDAFTEVQPEFIAQVKESAPAFRQYMDEQGYEMTPAAVHGFLVSTLNDIREKRMNANAAKPRKARKLAANETVETSTNNDGSRPEDMSADDFAINEILLGASELNMDITAPTR